jgi:FkbM family methyltransferase
MQVAYPMRSLLEKAALWLHVQHESAYSYYKVGKSSGAKAANLTALERNFYLKLKPGLQGENLVVYDIGAAKGFVASCLAKLPNVASIHAFEPIPDVYQELESYTRSFNKIQCHNVALGRTPGAALMNISKRTNSSSLLPMAQTHIEQFTDTEITKQISVPVARLDDYVQQQLLPLPDLVKIDVQGFEKQVLEGAATTIHHAKYCILEMSFQPLYDGSPLFDDIYQLMRQLGFKLVGVADPLVGKDGKQFQVDGIFENQRYSV